MARQSVGVGAIRLDRPGLWIRVDNVVLLQRAVDDGGFQNIRECGAFLSLGQGAWRATALAAAMRRLGSGRFAGNCSSIGGAETLEEASFIAAALVAAWLLSH